MSSTSTPESASVRETQSLGEALAGHRNSLGLVRLVLAIAVIFDHAFPLGGYGADPVHALTNGQATIGSLAVDGFFGISGYLITKSGASSDVIQFLWRRFLRIFPAYWTVLLLSAAVIGPIFWVLANNPFLKYFNRSDGGPIAYLTNNWTLRVGQYGIHDIFIATPWGQQTGSSVFNGSIWTLEYEWFAYMVIAFLCVTAVLTRARFLVPALTLLFAVMQFTNTVSGGALGTAVPYMADPYRVSLTLVFLFGACLAMYSKQIPFSGAMAIGAVVVVIGSLKYGGYANVGAPAFVYLVLWLGAALPARVQWVGAKNDYSYGIYIYGFLVQQMLAQLGVNDWGYVPYVAITIVITWGFAWLSWHAVEKWAMRLKDIGPGRGVRHWWTKVSTRIRRTKANA